MSGWQARNEVLRVIHETRARIRAARHRPKVKRVRMHPLDIQALERSTRLLAARPIDVALARVLGFPLEPDCGVERGHPVIDYEEETP